MKNDRKILCNVSDCTHNCIDDSTCKLESIKVSVCNNKAKDIKDKTLCASYENCGDLNVEEKKSSLNT